MIIFYFFSGDDIASGFGEDAEPIRRFFFFLIFAPPCRLAIRFSPILAAAIIL